MGYAAERYFAETFIRKGRRGRLLFELTAPTKRYEGVSRFCHGAEDLLEPSRILMQGEDLDRRPEFIRFIRQHCGICTVLSPIPEADGQTMPLADALSADFAGLDAFVIIGNSFAVVFGEPMKGGRGKFLLSEQ